MKNKFLFTFVFLSLILGISSAVNAQQVKSGKSAAAAKNMGVKKVSFNPSKRNPFLSKEEVIKIEQMKKAEQRRLAEEAAERERQAKAERERILKQRILEESNGFIVLDTSALKLTKEQVKENNSPQKLSNKYNVKH